MVRIRGLRDLLFYCLGAIPRGGVMLLLPESARPLLGCTLRSVDYKSGGARPPPQVRILIERRVRCRGLRGLLSYCLGAIPRGGVMLLLPESARLLCPWMNLALIIRLSFPDFASFLMDPVFCTTVAWGLVKPLALESSRQHPPGCYCIMHFLRDHTAGLTLQVYVTREIQVRVRVFVSTLVRSALPSYPNRCRVI